MKNVLHQGPHDALNGRLRASVAFVPDSDVGDRDVLDIGCGFGWCEVNFLGRGVGRMTGMELDESDLAAARGGVADERITFTTGSAIDLPFGDSLFDTVVSWEVIEHIPKNTEPEMLREIQRVLRPGGSLYLSTPFAQPLSTMGDPAWWLVGHRHYSRAQLQSLGTAAGLTMVQTEVRGGAWSVLGLINMYVAKWVFRRRPFFATFMSKRDAAEYSHDEGLATIFVHYRKPALATGH